MYIRGHYSAWQPERSSSSGCRVFGFSEETLTDDPKLLFERFIKIWCSEGFIVSQFSNAVLNCWCSRFLALVLPTQPSAPSTKMSILKSYPKPLSP